MGNKQSTTQRNAEGSHSNSNLRNQSELHSLLTSGFVCADDSQPFIPAAIQRIINRYCQSTAEFLVVLESDTAEHAFLGLASIDIANPKLSRSRTIHQAQHTLKLNRRGAYCLGPRLSLLRTGGEARATDCPAVQYSTHTDSTRPLPTPHTRRTSHRLLHCASRGEVYMLGGYPRGGGRSSFKSVERLRLGESQ